MSSSKKKSGVFLIMMHFRRLILVDLTSCHSNPCCASMLDIMQVYCILLYWGHVLVIKTKIAEWQTAWTQFRFSNNCLMC
jgi:hypothetical protein